MIVLWDPAALMSELKEKGDPETKIRLSSSTWILGMMTLASPGPDHWKSWEVKSVAARKGFGPGIYDTAMSLFGMIHADRKNVSSSAQKVWDQYKNKRQDVQGLAFDDKESPQTPQKVDDGDLHPGGKYNATNFAYKGAKVPAAAMRSLHNSSIAKIAKAAGLAVKDVNSLIIECAEDFFASKYGS